MSTIPTSITEEQFENHISPHLSKAKRGYVSKIPLYKIFNYILYAASAIECPLLLATLNGNRTAGIRQNKWH